VKTVAGAGETRQHPPWVTVWRPGTAGPGGGVEQRVRRARRARRARSLPVSADRVCPAGVGHHMRERAERAEASDGAASSRGRPPVKHRGPACRPTTPAERRPQIARRRRVEGELVSQ
jgi:hypothetical protein